jgi:hypothetical protein
MWIVAIVLTISGGVIWYQSRQEETGQRAPSAIPIPVPVAEEKEEETAATSTEVNSTTTAPEE